MDFKKMKIGDSKEVTAKRLDLSLTISLSDIAEIIDEADEDIDLQKEIKMVSDHAEVVNNEAFKLHDKVQKLEKAIKSSDFDGDEDARDAVVQAREYLQAFADLLDDLRNE